MLSIFWPFYSDLTFCQQMQHLSGRLLAALARDSILLAAHHDLPILLAAANIHTMLLAGRANRAMQPAV